MWRKKRATLDTNVCLKHANKCFFEVSPKVTHVTTGVGCSSKNHCWFGGVSCWKNWAYNGHNSSETHHSIKDASGPNTTSIDEKSDAFLWIVVGTIKTGTITAIASFTQIDV